MLKLILVMIYLSLNGGNILIKSNICLPKCPKLIYTNFKWILLLLLSLKIIFNL